MYYFSFRGSFTHPTREIDLVAFGKFIALECREEVCQLHHAIKNSQALQQIASGLNIWRPNAQAMVMELLSKYGGLPAVTHHMEHAKKNHNICSANGRGERAINAWMSARSVLLEVTRVTTVDGKREPSSRPKLVKRMYGILEAHVETSKIICSEMLMEQQKEWDDYIHNKLYNKQEIYEEKEYARTKASINLHLEETCPPCAAELRTGYDKFPFQYSLRRVGTLRKIYENAMRQELQAQEKAFKKEWNQKVGHTIEGSPSDQMDPAESRSWLKSLR
jgi:hypothetical protein